MKCRVCNSQTSLYYTNKNGEYFQCSRCEAIQLHPNFFLDQNKEKERYDKHSDKVEDVGYQNFVSPIVKAVKENFSTHHKGLDFGCGKTAIVQYLLQKEHFSCKGYDPMYFPNNELLNNKYDYITCCEVVEHFYNPQLSFKLLYQLLKEKGSLFLKTNQYNKSIDFSKWWYKNDPTHVIFYTRKTFEIIKKQLNFSDVLLSKEYVTFVK